MLGDHGVVKTPQALDHRQDKQSFQIVLIVDQALLGNLLRSFQHLIKLLLVGGYPAIRGTAGKSIVGSKRFTAQYMEPVKFAKKNHAPLGYPGRGIILAGR